MIAPNRRHADFGRHRPHRHAERLAERLPDRDRLPAARAPALLVCDANPAYAVGSVPNAMFASAAFSADIPIPTSACSV